MDSSSLSALQRRKALAFEVRAWGDLGEAAWGNSNSWVRQNKGRKDAETCSYRGTHPVKEALAQTSACVYCSQNEALVLVLELVDDREKQAL